MLWVCAISHINGVVLIYVSYIFNGQFSDLDTAKPVNILTQILATDSVISGIYNKAK